MKWNPNDPGPWRRRFAWVPTSIYTDVTIWWEYYEERKGGGGCGNVGRRLIGSGRVGHFGRGAF